MKRILSILFAFVFAVIAFASPANTFAAGGPGPGTQLQPGQQGASGSASQSIWVIDPEVTFIGKNAARAGLFLDWTLKNYNWVCVNRVTDRQCDDSNNPIAQYWSLIVLYIVVPLLFVVILATSIVIIITRGKSLTIMRFIPRFVAVVLLIVFSYSLLQFFYQFTDLIQGFFLRSNINNPCPPDCISQKDLLYVGWDYRTFVGLRLLGDQYAESAFISLLLTKLTALTYFVMVFLLLVRKIILWFFIIVSPIFPILLLYYPVRNTAKIWIGEFFRWLLYAPLFAIFLNGLVYLWKNQIPLVFVNSNIGNASQIVFPTAVNILLGGPRQFVTPTNSVNLIETFALYVVSLIMLWIVILLPWILLQIFLDYASNFAPGDTAVMKTLVNMATSNKQPPGGGGKSESPGGAAIALPFAKKFAIPKDLGPGPTGAAKELNVQNMQATFAQPTTIPTANINSANVNAQVLSAANVKVPSLRDIAKYDAALMSRDQSKSQEATRITQTLERIANPVSVTNTVEREKTVEIHNNISASSDKGNLVANSIMNAASITSRRNAQVSTQQMKESLKQMANPSLSNVANRDKMTKLNSMLVKESQGTSSKSEVAKSILKVNDKTSDKEIEKIQGQLGQVANTHMGKSVSSSVQQQAQATTSIKNVLSQMANPGSVTHTADKQAVTKLKATLEKASSEGNQLASSILKVSDKTSVEEIEALQQKIQEAKEKGEPVAAEVAALAQKTASLPTTNRVQNVSKEDYQAVKDMWKQNYQNLEVPQGMAGTRSEWIKDDVESIDETIRLLSSTNEEEVKEGMQQVSNILPFLMMGGFSQNEIVSYLQAKQDAAKEVSKTLAVEEEDKVSVSTTATHAAKTMVATMEQTDESSASSTSTSSSPSSSSDDDEDESPLSSLSNVTASTDAATPSTSASSNDVLKMVDLKMPKLKDIAQFETRALKNDAARSADREKIQGILEKIANPSKINDEAERTKFEKFVQTLQDEQQKGNAAAGSLLNASTGNAPEENKVQPVSDEDYEEIKKLWEENYRTLPVPAEFGSEATGRIAWIESDLKSVEETRALLESSDTAKKQEATQKLTEVMPMMLLGGFSAQEIAGYLKAKAEAGKNVIAELQKDEDSKVSVAATSTEETVKSESAETEKKEDSNN